MRDAMPDPDSLPTLAWSEFARERHRPGGPHVWFDGDQEQLLDLVRARWRDRRPGAGRADRSQVVVVPVPPDRFHGVTVQVTAGTPLQAVLEYRRHGEDPFIRVLADGEPETVRHAGVVLYSAQTLLENGGERSSDAAWEVVSLLAGPLADEPLDPVTMARNYLERPGGTFAPYTARQFAEAIWYWRERARRRT